VDGDINAAVDPAIAAIQSGVAFVEPKLEEFHYGLDQPVPHPAGAAGGTAEVDIEYTAQTPISLQVIQVVFATPNQIILPNRIEILTLGPFQGLEPLGELHACVDAGRNSPLVLGRGRPPGHPFRPYFYTPRQLQSESHGASVRIFDRPNAVGGCAAAFFEVAVISLDHGGTGRDRVLKAWTYSYGQGGAFHSPPVARIGKSSRSTRHEPE
jgi:hypothetical protein